MGSITIKVSELFTMASELRKDKMDYVTLMLSEAEGERDLALQPCIYFEAYQKGDSMGVGYDEIEAVPKEELKREFGLS